MKRWNHKLSCLLLLMASPAAWSQVVLDQSQHLRATNQAVGSDANQRLAQTFRAGMTGDLAMVKLALGCGSDPGDTVTVSLQTLDGAGKPSGTVLDSVSVSGTALPSPPVFDEGALHAFPLGGARVEAGQHYAIVVEANPGAGCALLVSGNDNPYAGGKSYFEALPNPPGWILDPAAPERDLVFETYVDLGGDSDAGGGLCDFRTADGTQNDWVPASVPICACLRDPGLAHQRCWFRMPGFVLVRELPLKAYKDFVARWSVLPLVDNPLPVEIELRSRSGKLVGDPLVIEGGKPLYAAPVPEAYWADGPDALDATRVIVRSGKHTFEFDIRRNDLPKP